MMVTLQNQLVTSNPDGRAMIFHVACSSEARFLHHATTVAFAIAP